VSVTTELSSVELAVRIAERIGRLSGAIHRLREARSNEIRAGSPDRDVEVSVDDGGRLVWLWLAPGTTTRFTSEALEELINDTLREAVDLALRRNRRKSLTTTGGRRSA
jgi:hypothetical protein